MGAIILGIVFILIFLAGCYFMGNLVLGTFGDNWSERLISSAYGILCWIVVGVVILICYGLYTIGIHLIG